MGDYSLLSIGLLILGTLVSLGSLVVLTFCVMALRSKDRAQQSAVSVDAVVLSHRLIEGCEFDGGAPVYEPRIEYEYEFNSQTWRSSNVWAGPNDSYYVSPRAADQILAQFPVGATVQAFCEPLAPDRAFLIREPPAEGVFSGCVLLAMSIILLVVIFSVAFSTGFVPELIAAHIFALVAVALWFLAIARGERGK